MPLSLGSLLCIGLQPRLKPLCQGDAKEEVPQGTNHLIATLLWQCFILPPFPSLTPTSPLLWHQLRTQVLTCKLGRDETVAQGLLALAHNKEVTDLVVGISGYR
jgi:hypothetical protein